MALWGTWVLLELEFFTNSDSCVIFCFARPRGWFFYSQNVIIWCKEEARPPWKLWSM
ncbi:hypothetical protein AMTRI_Chr06g193390 [Amborella trichopoda]